MTKKYLLPRFRAALEDHQKDLPSGTYWRYRNGRLPPPLGTLLLKYPELATALAEDAVALAKQRAQTNDERVPE